MIRENSTVLFFWGELTVDLNWTDKHFFSSSAQCHRIDVVSGCGKNAEGAVQTLSLVFHNRTQKKKTLTLVLPKFDFLWELRVCTRLCRWNLLCTKKSYLISCPYLNTHTMFHLFSARGPLSHDGSVFVLQCRVQSTVRTWLYTSLYTSSDTGANWFDRIFITIIINGKNMAIVKDQLLSTGGLVWVQVLFSLFLNLKTWKGLAKEAIGAWECYNEILVWCGQPGRKWSVSLPPP